MIIKFIAAIIVPMMLLATKSFAFGTALQDSTSLFKKADSLKSADSAKLPFLDTLIHPKYYYGLASFYSKSLEGTETSTGERFKHAKFTAASNRFKLGTWLRVTNLSNDKSIIVRVNDRMHPRMDRRGRIVDLTYAGAKKLNFVVKGVTKVKVEVVPKGTKE